ncbi:MAG: DUF952 domain-containing protein [Cyanobacteria bacterium P01_F01_bin.42]
MGYLYHITEKSAWEQAQADGVYTAPSLDTEDFIHLSARDQVIGTANRFYRGRENLLLLEIDRDRLQSRLQYDPVPEHGTFPHLYGPLNLDAIVRATPLIPENDGGFTTEQI